MAQYCVRLEERNNYCTYSVIYELFIESELPPRELADKLHHMVSYDEVSWIPCEFKWGMPYNNKTYKTPDPDFIDNDEYHNMYHWEEESGYRDESYTFTISEIKKFRKI